MVSKSSGGDTGLISVKATCGKFLKVNCLVSLSGRAVGLNPHVDFGEPLVGFGADYNNMCNPCTPRLYTLHNPALCSFSS